VTFASLVIETVRKELQLAFSGQKTWFFGQKTWFWSKSRTFDAKITHDFQFDL